MSIKLDNITIIYQFYFFLMDVFQPLSTFLLFYKEKKHTHALLALILEPITTAFGSEFYLSLFIRVSKQDLADDLGIPFIYLFRPPYAHKGLKGAREGVEVTFVPHH